MKKFTAIDSGIAGMNMLTHNILCYSSQASLQLHLCAHTCLSNFIKNSRVFGVYICLAWEHLMLVHACKEI